MAALTHGERLQPSLLDRLKDDYPHKRKEGESGPPVDEVGRRERGPDTKEKHTDARNSFLDSDATHVIDSRQLKEFVKRDLAWLLNTGCLEDSVDMSACPNVADSVLNFGIPDLTGLVAANVNTQVLERKLASVITRFEPRIIKRSLRISISTSEEMSGNALKFEIECDVWGQPVPERMYLLSSIDLEDGTFKFQERGA